MSTNVSYTSSKDGISVVISGRTTYFEKSHVNYEKAKALIVAGDKDGLAALTKAKSTQLNDEFIAEFEGVEIFRNTAFFNGIELSAKLVARMVETATEGLPLGPLVNLFKNLNENPSNRCVEGFFTWLDKNHLSYTDDGHFLAYKIVDNNFMDCRTKTFDNSPGKPVEVPRNTVDDDPSKTCSHGLHGCGMEYLPHYGSWVGAHRIVCIKVNPAHLVAFPTDYEHSKFRCHKYLVIEEIDKATAEEYFKAKPTGPKTDDLEDETLEDDEEDFGHDDDDEGDDHEDEEADEDIVELDVIEMTSLRDASGDPAGWAPYYGHDCETMEECEDFVTSMNQFQDLEYYRIKPDVDGAEQTNETDATSDDFPFNAPPAGDTDGDEPETPAIDPPAATPTQTDEERGGYIHIETEDPTTIIAADDVRKVFQVDVGTMTEEEVKAELLRVLGEPEPTAPLVGLADGVSIETSPVQDGDVSPAPSASEPDDVATQLKSLRDEHLPLLHGAPLPETDAAPVVVADQAPAEVLDAGANIVDESQKLEEAPPVPSNPELVINPFTNKPI